MILINQYGMLLTLSSLLVNIVFCVLIFWFSSLLQKIFGRTGAKVVSKLASLLLAAFAVMMVRKGIVAIITAAG
jgi:multiple antibiotic resistance protein